jgi:hypothetical protein
MKKCIPNQPARRSTKFAIYPIEPKIYPVYLVVYPIYLVIDPIDPLVW